MRSYLNLFFAIALTALSFNYTLANDEETDEETHSHSTANTSSRDLNSAGTIVSDGMGNSYEIGACLRPPTRGLVFEPLFELVQGRYKAAHLHCCATMVQEACGENISTLSGVELKSSMAANCVGQARSSFTACGSSSCKKWGVDCNDFSIDKIKRAVQALRN